MRGRLRTPLSTTVSRTSIGLAAAAPLAVLLFACTATSESGLQLSREEVFLKRGDGYYFNSRYEEAVREYSLAVEEAPGMAEAYRSRGYAFTALDRLPEAAADFDHSISLKPAFAEAHLGRGVLYFRQGKYSEAIDDFDRVIELDPWNASARHYKALACEKVGRLREAVEAYKGYIHCTVPRDDKFLDQARKRIEELEKQPLR